MTKALSSDQIARYGARLQGLRLLPILRDWQIRRAIRRLARDGSPAAMTALKAGTESGLLRQTQYRKRLEIALILDADQSRAERVRAFLRGEIQETTAAEQKPGHHEAELARPEPTTAEAQRLAQPASEEQASNTDESPVETSQPEAQPVDGVTREIKPGDGACPEQVATIAAQPEPVIRYSEEIRNADGDEIAIQEVEAQEKTTEEDPKEPEPFTRDKDGDNNINAYQPVEVGEDEDETPDQNEHRLPVGETCVLERSEGEEAEQPSQLFSETEVSREQVADEIAEVDDSDTLDDWRGTSELDASWDPQDDPIYPWISKLDRYVWLDPEERRLVIAKIAQSDLSVEDWIEKLLHQRDESLTPTEQSINPLSLEAILEDAWVEEVPEIRALTSIQLEPAETTERQQTDQREEDAIPEIAVSGDFNEVSTRDLAAQRDLCGSEDGSTQPLELCSFEQPSASAHGATALLLDDWCEESADQISTCLVECANQLLRDDNKKQRGQHSSLLAGLLTFHLREKQAASREYTAHLSMNDDALEQDSACIARATLVSIEPFRSNKHEAIYRFDTRQPFRLSARGNNTEQLVCQHSRVKLQLREVLATDGLIKLAVHSRDANNLLPLSNLIHQPKDIAGLLRGHLAEQAPAWIKDATAIPAAVSHLLSREGNDRFRLLARQARNVPEQTAQLISDALFNVDGLSLILQGPPGTGKTTCAAEVIARLVDAGWNVGICANSHLAINHLLMRTAEYARDNQQTISLAKFQSKASKEEREKFSSAGISVIDNTSFSHKHDVYGATVFGFSHQRFEGLLDLLVIDEASQVSLANLLTMGRCARNLLLVGDQQQLAQPTIAEHPGESGLSCLRYATEGEPVIADHKGVFLSRSWRLPPKLSGFISEQFYEGKLETHASNSNNHVTWSGAANGLHFEKVEHNDNHVYSQEEAMTIQFLVTELLGRPYTRQTAAGPISATLCWDDIAIMAPFNAQVNLLQRTLGTEAQVGTVDRFQGREAPVSIYSVTSSRSISTRGLEFVLDANRVNVAISRAQCLAIVVASPVVADLLNSSESLRREANLFTSLSTLHHSTPTQP